MADYSAYKNIKVEIRDGIGWAILESPGKAKCDEPGAARRDG